MDKTIFVYVLVNEMEGTTARLFSRAEDALAAALADAQEWWEVADLDEEEQMEERRAFDRDVVNGGYADPNEDSGAVVVVQAATVE